MSIRQPVQDFVKLGPLPASNAATERELERRVTLLGAISTPVTDEEAMALAESFGPDECFGVAWTLLHVIETAPTLPRPSEDAFSRSEWLRMVWTKRR